MVTPCLTSTDTVAESPEAAPAVPEIVVDALLVDDPSTGLTTATPEGPAVSTVNVLPAEFAVFPAVSDWDAVTV